ARFR
ncbi:hypothetical protein VCHENC02_1696B, partial [Vibrio harveyi]